MLYDERDLDSYLRFAIPHGEVENKAEHAAEMAFKNALCGLVGRMAYPHQASRAAAFCDGGGHYGDLIDPNRFFARSQPRSWQRCTVCFPKQGNSVFPPTLDYLRDVDDRARGQASPRQLAYLHQLLDLCADQVQRTRPKAERHL